MLEPDLNKICNGHLQREFLRYLPEVLLACRNTGKSGSITFRLTIKPVFSNGEGGIAVSYNFISKVRATPPSLQDVETYAWEDGELASADATMSLPFQDAED